MGVEIKKCPKKTWWSTYVYQREDIVGLDSAILSHPRVLEHSGHTDTFSDWLVDCRECQHRFQVDRLRSDVRIVVLPI